MKNTLKLMLAIALLVCAVPVAFAQKKPDFSGIWRRTEGEQLLTIEHREPKIHLVYWIKDNMGERTLDLTAMTDGKEHKQTVMAQPATVVMRWEGAGLFWEIWRQTPFGQIHNRRTLKLAADGQSITAERVDFNTDGTERKLTETWTKTTPPAQKSAADSKAEQGIQQFGAELVAAYERNDTAALDRLYADDFIGTDVVGHLYHKTALLGAIKSGRVKYEAVKIDDLKIQVHGEVAIVNGRVSIKLRVNGQPQEESVTRDTTTLVKRQGQWRMIASHASLIVKQ